MQVKKDEVKNAIIEIAEKEFYIYGFEKASIRKIVKKAGTTIGNFYNYFENKEALFEAIVNEEYNSFIHFIKHHDNIEMPDYYKQVIGKNNLKQILSQLAVEIMPNFTSKFVILIECSVGTKYENARKLLVATIIEHLNDHLNELNIENSNINISEVLAEQLINGIIFILRKYKDTPEEKNKMLSEYILFYFFGTMGLLGIDY